jgi:hypothetical protein
MKQSSESQGEKAKWHEVGWVMVIHPTYVLQNYLSGILLCH